MFWRRDAVYRSVGWRIGISIAASAAMLTGCPVTEIPGRTIELLSNDGTRAELTVVDESGLLANAHSAPEPGSGSDFEVISVPGTSDQLRVSWIASPCQATPRLVVAGATLNDLQVDLDAGPMPPDIECPDIGVGFSVDLEFEGDVEADEVASRRTDR